MREQAEPVFNLIELLCVYLGGAIAPGIRYTHGIVGTANTNYWFSNWKTQGVEALLAYRW